MKTELKEKMEIFRMILDECLEDELGMPKDDSEESEGRDNILRVLMPQIEVLFLDVQSSDALVAAAYLDARELLERRANALYSLGAERAADELSVMSGALQLRTAGNAQSALESLKLEIRKQAFWIASTHWPDFSSAAGWECSCGCKVVGKAGWQEHIRSLISKHQEGAGNGEKKR